MLRIDPRRVVYRLERRVLPVGTIVTAERPTPATGHFSALDRPGGWRNPTRALSVNFTFYFTHGAARTMLLPWADVVRIRMGNEPTLYAADTPLAGPSPAEVPLADPPLVRVIAQVRFPVLASVEKRRFIGPFQEAIRKDYPVLRPEHNRGLVLGRQGVVDEHSNTAWRFHDATGAWRVTLAPDFLALETEAYTSRRDFMQRFGLVLLALEEHVDPQVVDRIGVRYIDRVPGENLRALPQLVRPEVAGILASPLSGHVRHAISENVFMLPDDAGHVTARWGLVPARGTVDPGAVDPIDEPSWLLDVDAFQHFPSGDRVLEADAIVEQTRGFAERIYSIFRWVVTDEFLRRYGGEP